MIDAEAGFRDHKGASSRRPPPLRSVVIPIAIRPPPPTASTAHARRRQRPRRGSTASNSLGIDPPRPRRRCPLALRPLPHSPPPTVTPPRSPKRIPAISRPDLLDRHGLFAAAALAGQRRGESAVESAATPATSSCVLVLFGISFTGVVLAVWSSSSDSWPLPGLGPLQVRDWIRRDELVERTASSGSKPRRLPRHVRGLKILLGARRQVSEWSSPRGPLRPVARLPPSSGRSHAASPATLEDPPRLERPPRPARVRRPPTSSRHSTPSIPSCEAGAIISALYVSSSACASRLVWAIAYTHPAGGAAPAAFRTTRSSTSSAAAVLRNLHDRPALLHLGCRRGPSSAASSSATGGPGWASSSPRSPPPRSRRGSRLRPANSSWSPCSASASPSSAVAARSSAARPRSLHNFVVSV